VESLIEEADRVLGGEPEVRNFQQAQDGDCWVVSRSIMGPIYIGAPQTKTVQLSDKPQTVEFNVDARTPPIAHILQPPNGTVKYHFHEADRALSVWKLYLGAKRIRNCVAFLAEIPIPFRYVFLSKTLKYPFNDTQDLLRYHPETRVAIQNPALLKPWFDHVGESFALAADLLHRLSLDSALGRAVSLAGGAIWTDDPEDSFLSAWRSVDVIAKLDYSEISNRGDPAADASITEDERDWSDSRKIREALSRRVPGLDPRLVGKLNELRGKVAHDTVTATAYRQLLELRWTAFDIASDCVRSRLTEDGFGFPVRSKSLLG
jgi:hypothetical protein